jgi:hypothetical protein
MIDEPAHERPRSGAIAYLAAAAVLNLPLAACHPGWPLLPQPLLRSLVVGLVLFFVPGIPWTGILIGRGWRSGLAWLWTIAASLLSLLAVLVAIRLAGLPLTGSAAWNGVWLLTNGAIVLNACMGGPPAWGALPRDRFGWLAVPLFLAAYAGFLLAAIEVVPPMEDQDFDVLGCGYSLLTRFEPLLVSDHQSVYQFAHPPLAHYITAASFLYFDRLDYLAYYDAASRRADAARQGRPFVPFAGTVGGLSGGTGQHRVLSVDGADYLIDPPLADGSRRIPVWLLENGVLGQYYDRDPQRLVARTPHVFLAALTVALLGVWIGRTTGRWTLAVLTPLAYATSPEIVVRSAYAGHFAASNFAVLAVLMAVDALEPRAGRKTTSRLGAAEYKPVAQAREPRSGNLACASGFNGGRLAWLDCLLAGGLATLADHKLLPLPAAILLWGLLRGGSARRILRPHPVVLGFVAGTALFWTWGFCIDAGEFFRDHLQMHLIDRVRHWNPEGYVGYPTVAELWLELWRHTGYLLLPLGVAALLINVVSGTLRVPPANGTRSVPDTWGQGGQSHFRRTKIGTVPVLWLLWTFLTAAVFSLVDWRQTKHLMPLLIPLCVAPAWWAATGRLRLALVLAALAGLTAWNLASVWGLVENFAGLPITPAW